eukprot:TRINITY_DN6126_c0_g2_i1.p1 TRINITY_DN6126_c0_g2~~TRINITY_DN6126_c0_g2_i1.p1  ORF type:complete len:177 (+),score=8.63 TRINITY_DN6126_c0_g2_i1:555-1085(+)
MYGCVLSSKQPVARCWTRCRRCRGLISSLLSSRVHSHQICAPGSQERRDALCTLRGHSESISALAFSSVGSIAISGSRDRCVKIWQWETQSLLRTIEHPGPIYGMQSQAFSLTPRVAVACGAFGVFEVSEKKYRAAFLSPGELAGGNRSDSSICSCCWRVYIGCLGGSSAESGGGH